MQTDPVLLSRARGMRRDPSPAEQTLWFALRDRRFADAKFVRQTVAGAAIPDFCCRAKKLVIELDGHSHGSTQVADAERTARLAKLGYRVIRFSNSEIMSNLEGVLHAIGVALASPPHPTLSPEGRGLFNEQPSVIP